MPMNLMRLSPRLREQGRRDRRADVGDADHPVDLGAVGGEDRADLLGGGFLVVGVGEVLENLHGPVGLADGGVDRLDPGLRVRVDQAARDVDDLARVGRGARVTHGGDQGLGADVGRVVDVGGEAERRRGRFAGATAGRDARDALLLQLVEQRVRSVGVTGEDVERVVALGHERLDHVVLRRQLPLRRELVDAANQAEVLHGVRRALLQG